MTSDSKPAPLILFGAFDRHNLGDLLFPHVVASMLGAREVVFAGVAERDLRAFGGHEVEAISRLARRWGDQPADLIHVGGEILTVDAWEAAVMVLAPEEAGAVIGLHESHRRRLCWAQDYLGIRHRAAYVAPRALFRNPGRFVFNAVGGVEFAGLDPRLSDEVAQSLRGATFVGARERVTLDHLGRAGVAARLMPDAAVMVKELFGENIRRHGESGEPASVRKAFPQGYVAVQFSADFGDDATLAAIAAQFDRVAAEAGLGVALFRAGAAPWHDDLDVYRRAASRMRAAPARVFESLDIWDICALIAASRGYCGSSLHGRIVALAYGLPRISMVQPAMAQGAGTTKQEAFVATWESADAAGIVAPENMAAGLLAALNSGRDEALTAARRLSALYRERFEELRSLLGA